MSDDVLNRLRAAIKDKERELEELKHAEKVLLSYSSVKQKPRPKLIEGSIKAHIMTLLTEFPSGLPASSILEKLKGDVLPQLVRTSLSPQLSRLKQEGRIEYIDKKWKIFSQEDALE